MATDDEIRAYENELQGIDEWETMHASEMELMTSNDETFQANPKPFNCNEEDSTLSKTDSSQPSAESSNVQNRLDDVLQRCARLLGEEKTIDHSPTTRGHKDITMNPPRRSLLLGQHVALPSVREEENEQYVLRQPPIMVDSISIVLPGGERRFLRKKSRVESGSAITKLDVVLARSVPEMISSIEERQVQALVSNENAIAEKKPAKEQMKTDHQLWVDKYRPKRFTDLLSDEKVNREVLFWIKEWDKIVFLDHPNHSYSLQKNAANLEKRTSIKEENPVNTSKTDRHLDARPKVKIILLCGPPGAGKTTLAHIIAKHAGYNAVEINASDDRTAQVLRNKIISAMEMQSLHKDKRPNCIILDEIDGAMNAGDSKSAISAIQRMATAPYPPSRQKSNQKNESSHPLSRPLICICNDQYAPVLRPLRKIAKIFLLHPPSLQRLVARLKYISRLEGLTINSGALGAFCRRNQCDIRHCLNALQIRHKTKGRESNQHLSSDVSNSKEINHDLFMTMQAIFHTSHTTHGNCNADQESKSSNGKLSSFNHVYQTALSYGNWPMLLTSLEENISWMMYNDPTMHKTCFAFDWIGMADIWNSQAYQEQQFQLMMYIPFAAVALHSVCSSTTSSRIVYPRASFDVLIQREKTKNITGAFVEKIGHRLPWLRASTGWLMVDVIPWILRVLSPDIALNSTSYRTNSKNPAMERLIEIMIYLGLSYRHQSTLRDEQDNFILEPALHELGVFGKDSDGNRAYHIILPLALRKIVGREVELEIARKIERVRNAGITDDSSHRSREAASLKISLANKSGRFTGKEMHLKEAASRISNPFAYAHREAQRKRKREMQGLTSPTAQLKRSSIRYKHNRGYTSGIKTAVYIRDLL
uniref:Chromosome transmission fidelity protein putative n=1 Tax=Albugo laibachii Nc14 TaxID=890382 RepID=F0W2X1_9STRA|nr:chromosome transmission fidelity protein putative [Albugo laibachii Nc14]|eukprot:CCA15408.1 chromosome transmission fidelity protein putative [Albugo laibachii Nc14]